MRLSGFPRVIAALARGALRSIAGAVRFGLARLGLTNWIRREFAPLTGTEAGLLGRLAQKYLSAGAQQQAMPGGMAINPADVPRVTEAGMPPGSTGAIQYDTRVHWRDPVSGREDWSTVFIDTGAFLTLDQLFQRMQQKFLEIFPSSPDEAPGGEAISPAIMGYAIVGIVQS